MVAAALANRSPAAATVEVVGAGPPLSPQTGIPEALETQAMLVQWEVAKQGLQELQETQLQELQELQEMLDKQHQYLE